MSADNWRQCPRCVKEASEKCNALDGDLSAAYGTVSLKEYEETRLETQARVREIMAVASEEVMREDYDVGMDGHGKEFAVSYRAYCTRCGAEFKFEAEQTVRWGVG